MREKAARGWGSSGFMGLSKRLIDRSFRERKKRQKADEFDDGEVEEVMGFNRVRPLIFLLK